jgi:DNA polymerase delta subunit 2
LVGISVDVSHFVSGVVVGVSGVQNEEGDFEVSEILSAGFPPQAPIKRQDNPRYLALVSGLNVGGSHQNPVTTQLFADYLGGLVGSPTEQSEFVASIARLIVAGNSFCREDEQPQPAKLRDPNKKLSRDEQTKIVVSIQLLDSMFKDLSHDIPIDVMPGPSDPADYSMPQQPINKFLLPHSAGQKTVNLVTNPYRCTIDGVHILGTSGQPTDNIAMCT